jgi:23S rRNA (pseudouridine1915-N3)-methyltransferase
MKISLIVIGKKMPDWIQTGINHYQKQLPDYLNFSLIALEAQKRKGKNIQQIKELEGEIIIKATKGASFVIAFDEHGKQNTTKNIAQQLGNWQQNGENIALIIGGADGLSDTVKIMQINFGDYQTLLYRILWQDYWPLSNYTDRTHY